jgi:hypothetical protein
MTRENFKINMYTSFTAGTSNSNLSESHITKKKCSAGHNLWKKAFAARNLQEKWVAQMHLAGHMWFVGSVFETPDLMACNEDPPYSIILNEIKNK